LLISSAVWAQTDITFQGPSKLPPTDKPAAQGRQCDQPVRSRDAGQRRGTPIRRGHGQLRGRRVLRAVRQLPLRLRGGLLLERLRSLPVGGIGAIQPCRGLSRRGRRQLSRQLRNGLWAPIWACPCLIFAINGIGAQFGISYGAYDLDGKANPGFHAADAEQQIFITAGLFHRPTEFCPLGLGKSPTTG